MTGEHRCERLRSHDDLTSWHRAFRAFDLLGSRRAHCHRPGPYAAHHHALEDRLTADRAIGQSAGAHA